jgi:aminoglycoside 3-N-acetyltransferase I
MIKNTIFNVRRLARKDVFIMKEMLEVFGTAFSDVETYSGSCPTVEYLEHLLTSDSFIAIAASKDGEIVGGLAAYELRKFERERSEIYIYDLAVAEKHRREGIATSLIVELKRVAMERGAYVIYVQADLSDYPAISLYSKLGVRKDVLHFDIPVKS